MNALAEAVDDTRRRIQRGQRAGADVLRDQVRAERELVRQLNQRLTALQRALRNRLLAGPGSVTDFRRFDLQARLAEVDRLIAETQALLLQDAEGTLNRMSDLGGSSVDQVLDGAQLLPTQSPLGLDRTVIQASFDNAVELLTTPMQQFALDVKQGLRGVVLAGDNRFDAIQRLRDKIGGQGFDNAQYRAERIIRTEVGRVFNQANFTRMLGLSEQFPFLRKGWRAVGDNRTRKGHIEAGQTYGRGSGIAVSQPFRINVYQQLPKNVTGPLLGTVELLFPVDPNATPAGRLAAGATIMCRCQSFVDFDVADFEQFSRQQVSQATGNIVPPPGPVPVPRPQVPKRRTTRSRKATKAPGNPTKYQAAGPAVSRAVQFPDTPRYGRIRRGRSGQPLELLSQQKVKRALALIDEVHGDGNLPEIPVYKTSLKDARAGTKAYYARNARTDKPLEFAYGPDAMKTHPHMATFHETGHFLDHVGFNQDITTFSSDVDPLFNRFREAAGRTKAIQQWRTWQSDVTTRPELLAKGPNVRMINYALEDREVFARSYAQWVATKSGDAAALKELRNMQAASRSGIGTIEPGTPFNRRSYGQSPEPGTWDVPMQWDDDDFAELSSILDDIFEVTGWRTRTSQ